MVTREGYVKRTCATEFENIHSNGIRSPPDSRTATNSSTSP